MFKISRLCFVLLVTISLLSIIFGNVGASSVQIDLSFLTKTTSDGLGGNNISDVIVDNGRIYVATEGGLSISTDGGATFQNRTTANGLIGNRVTGVLVVGNTIYASTFDGLSISTDGGAHFVSKTTLNGLGHHWVHEVFVIGSKVYAATHGGLSISTDGGNSFVNKTTANGLGSDLVLDVLVNGNTIYAATQGGLSISTDGGNHFSNNALNGLGKDNTVNAIFSNNNIIYVSTMGGLFISADGGATFSKRTTLNGLGNNLITGTFVEQDKVYVVTYGGGLSISIDGCATFSTTYNTTNGLADNFMNSVFVSEGKVYVATFSGLSIGSVVNKSTLTFSSLPAQDGWILESSDVSGTGGTMDSAATTLRLGDDVTNHPYRSILSFSTAALPDNAVITSAVLKIKQSGAAVGTNPFVGLGNILVDVRKGMFGTALLELSDFSAPASASKFGSFGNTPVNGVYSLTLNNTARSFINLAGATQFRLYFGVKTNNNSVADYLAFLSGNNASGRPELVITYTVP